MDAGAINPYIPRTLGLPIVAIALTGVVFLGVARWPGGGRARTARQRPIPA